MFQQILAIIIIVFFLARIFWQRKNNALSQSEFNFWLIFWFLALLAIIFLKKIDALVADLGFSGQGIDVLFYLAVIILFYFIFRLRLRMEKIEKNITKIVQEIALKK